MSNVIDNLLNKLVKFDFNQVMNQVLAQKSVQEFIILLNTRDQLFKESIDSNGIKLSAIGGPYSIGTQKITLGVSFSFEGLTKSKIAGESPFLFDTGEFYDSFDVKLSKDFFEITADAQKDDTNLLEEWGEDILGLTQDNINILADVLKPQFIQIIKEQFLKLV